MDVTRICAGHKHVRKRFIGVKVSDGPTREKNQLNKRTLTKLNETNTDINIE
jgi:hypothetical protein